jgi:hypothetical protein
MAKCFIGSFGQFGRNHSGRDSSMLDLLHIQRRKSSGIKCQSRSFGQFGQSQSGRILSILICCRCAVGEPSAPGAGRLSPDAWACNRAFDDGFLLIAWPQPHRHPVPMLQRLPDDMQQMPGIMHSLRRLMQRRPILLPVLSNDTTKSNTRIEPMR